MAVLDAPKPEPDTVTVAPTLPLVGDRVILGVTVKFAPSSELVINYQSPGVLQAVGTSSAPILFTSTGGTTPSSWIALYIGGSGSTVSQISYATVEYAGWTAYCRGGLQIAGTSSVIDHVTFRVNNVELEIVHED